MPATSGAADADRPDELAVLLQAAVSLARDLGRDDLVTRLRSGEDRTPSCRVLVLGEFKQGKSALVNALLNLRVCGVDPTAVTGIATTVTYGPELSATALGTVVGPGEPSREVLPLAAVPALTMVAPLSSAASGPYAGVVVTAPRELLQAGLEVVDTPGIGGGMSAGNASAVLRAVTSADAVVFVSDAGTEYTRSELEFLREVVTLCPRVIGALTKTDFYPRWRAVLEADREHLRRERLDFEIVPLSSSLRLRGLAARSDALVVASGYPRLSAALRDVLRHSADADRTGTAAVIVDAASQLANQVQTELASLQDEDSAASSQRDWEEQALRAAELVTGRGWHRALADEVLSLSSDVDYDLGSRFRALRREASERIEREDPTRDWVEFGRWLNQATNETLVEHTRLLGRRAEQVADAVAREFGATAHQLRVAAAVREQWTTRDEIALASVAVDRSTRLQVGLMAARGGSTGMIFAHAAGLAAGLTLTALLPVGTVVAAVLAGVSWKYGRRAQARTLRAEAERAVALYLTEVEPQARKFSRDAALGLERQLRQTFEERAQEMLASAQRNAETALAQRRIDAQTRKERVEGATEQLRRLEKVRARASSLLSPAAEPAGRASR